MNDTIREILVQDGKEDGFAVTSLIETILLMYKAANPRITQFFFKSNGAGCFAGVELLLFSNTQHLTNVRCLMHLLSETCGGKSALDTHFYS
jgi:hypothetical protein